MERIQMTISVTPETAIKVVQLLADERTDKPVSAVPVQTTPVQAAPVQRSQTANTAPVTKTAPIQTAPISTPAQTVPAATTAPVRTAPEHAAPTSQLCSYTLGQIQTACAPLMDAGKQQELVGLLAQFGVQALPQLSPEQYGAFATALRGLGAKI